VTAWAEFLLAIMSFESLAGIARRDRRSPTTPAYQLAKLFMVLDGIQDAVVLSGRVQADEMMYPVPAADRDPLLAGRRAGGLLEEQHVHRDRLRGKGTRLGGLPRPGARQAERGACQGGVLSAPVRRHRARPRQRELAQRRGAGARTGQRGL
jgi:hypothetical protein